MSSSEVAFQDAGLAWDVAADAPALFEILSVTRHGDWLAAWRTERRGSVPTLASHRPVSGSLWCRPAGHARAMYSPLPVGSSTLCVKGTEACSPAIESELEEAVKRDMHAKYVNQLEWWLRAEQKAPYVYTVKEGLTEARVAAQMQVDYHRRFGRLARLPVPIAVYKFPESLRVAYLTKLRSLCSPGLHELAEFVVGSGLGAYVYFLEGTYERVDVLGTPAAAEKGGYSRRKEELAARVAASDVKASLIAWVRLVVELLAIGWLPTNFNADSTGQMVRFINATIDGGFVDVDSARRISDVPSDQDFYKSFWYMICELASCYTVAMAGNCKFPTGVFASNWYPSPNYGDAMCTVAVWDTFVACVGDARRAGAVFDQRIEMLLSSQSPFEKLETMLHALFPPTTAVQCGGTGSEKA
jgi:hypothetical protein